jgi:hypothetical protein
VTALVREACAAGARREAACAVLGVSPRSLQRWAEGGGVKADGRLAAARGRVPANKLGPAERQRILATANSPEFAALPPGQMVPRLADRGEYIASESSVYRILRAGGQSAHRGKVLALVRQPGHYLARRQVGQLGAVGNGQDGLPFRHAQLVRGGPPLRCRQPPIRFHPAVFRPALQGPGVDP